MVARILEIELALIGLGWSWKKMGKYICIPMYLYTIHIHMLTHMYILFKMFMPTLCKSNEA